MRNKIKRKGVAGIGKAIRLLESVGDRNVAQVTHQARKHFKKLRALLRYARLRFDKETYKIENACFRDAGRTLGDVRDARVLVATLDDLRARIFAQEHPPLLVHARQLLSANERRQVKHLVESEKDSELLILLRAAIIRPAEWEIGSFGWKVSRQSIKRSYKRARKTARAAAEDSTVDNLHEWRKRVKDLWYHTRFLRRACPEFMNEFARELHTLSDYLGDDHDLAMLREALFDRQETLNDSDALERLLAVIDVRRKELIDAALDLGTRLLEQKPGEFSRQLKEKRRSHKKAQQKLRELTPLVTDK